MNPAHKKYFLLLLPWLAWSFCVQIFFPSDFLAGTAITAGKTFFALLSLLVLALSLCGLIGLYRATTDKLVRAFAGTPLVFVCAALLLFSVSSHFSALIFLTTLFAPVAYVCAVCALMLFRISRKKRIFPLVAVLLLALTSPFWQNFVFEKTTGTPLPLPNVIFDFSLFLLFCASPIAVLGLYLRFCVPAKETAEETTPASVLAGTDETAIRPGGRGGAGR